MGLISELQRRHCHQLPPGPRSIQMSHSTSRHRLSCTTRLPGLQNSRINRSPLTSPTSVVDSPLCALRHHRMLALTMHARVAKNETTPPQEVTGALDVPGIMCERQNHVRFRSRVFTREDNFCRAFCRFAA